jgi:hypothetical protein
MNDEKNLVRCNDCIDVDKMTRTQRAILQLLAVKSYLVFHLNNLRAVKKGFNIARGIGAVANAVGIDSGNSIHSL